MSSSVSMEAPSGAFSQRYIDLYHELHPRANEYFKLRNLRRMAKKRRVPQLYFPNGDVLTGYGAYRPRRLSGRLVSELYSLIPKSHAQQEAEKLNSISPYTFSFT